MAYEIFTGLRLESLVAEHQHRFAAPLVGPQPWIVLQNQSLAHWIKLFLARSLGGYASADFLYQDEALRRLLALIDPLPSPPLFVDELKWSLFRKLKLLAAQRDDERFFPLWGAEGRTDEVRVFELADALAGLFHTYSVNSPLLCHTLEASEPSRAFWEDAANWAWQAALWKDYSDPQGPTLAGLLLDRWADPPCQLAQRPSLVLVGSTFLSRRALTFFRSWAEQDKIDVTHLLLLPSTQPASRWPNRRPWSSWGRFGRAFLEGLPELPESPVLTLAATALEKLQHALASGQTPPPLEPDPTLEVLSCPHPWRELEVLRDRIFQALADDPTLEVHEIAVLAPDINVYTPFFDAVFASDLPTRNLPYHVIDLDLGRENEGLQALDALLSLLSGTLDRPKLFALIDTPVFREAWKLEAEDRDLWLDYTETVSAWREGPHDQGPQTWSAGEDRLWSGWFGGAERGPVTGLEAPSSAYRSLARLHDMIHRLQNHARQCRTERSLSAWIQVLETLAAEFLGSGEETVRVLIGRMHALDTLDEQEALTLGWAGFRAFVQDQIAHFPGRRGQLLTEGLHCSSFRPLRAIPFRFVAILGLDEAAFPRPSPRWSFDLTRRDPDSGDLSPVALDRWTFWETIMAARDRLHLSYGGRNPTDGSVRSPSSLVSDLLELLEQPDRPWPVTSVSVKDFSVLTPSDTTSSPRTARRALALQEQEKGGRQASAELKTHEASFPEVSTQTINEALLTPARFYLKRVAQVALRDEDQRSNDTEEPWSLSFFDRHLWIQRGLEAFWQGRDNAWDVEAWLTEAQALGRVRSGVFAQRNRRELEQRARAARAWSLDLRAQGWQRDTSAVRSLWAGRPFSSGGRLRLKGAQGYLYPHLAWTQTVSARSIWEVGIEVLADRLLPSAMAVLTPSGTQDLRPWTYNDDETQRLAGEAESLWEQASQRPLGLYPEFCEALADLLKKTEEPTLCSQWNDLIDRAWWDATQTRERQSRSSLAQDPWANLAFSSRPESLPADVQRYWKSFFVPLMEAF